ncbi:MAG TPA: AAA family ATPase [Solirubrobacteraceae bacterium]|nr:AAA family ATPase [Solirubrobacteraceae bacterium]
MRIAITGAHGVGKSTLAARISEALGLPELPTPGRALAARGLPVNETATVSSQLVAWLLQFRLERERSAWVASRSLIDVWAYTVLAAARYEQDPVEAALLQELARVTPLALTGAYDALIYVPVGIALISDEVRSADATFQRTTDEAIRNALSGWSIPHVTIDVRDSTAVATLVGQLADACIPGGST